jgi:hypothetical protein
MIKDSTSVYRNEEIAIEAFKEYRIRKGIVCKKCSCQKHYCWNLNVNSSARSAGSEQHFEVGPY